MSIKLRELIRSIRACKTAAEERSVIARECALIRTAFKEEDNHYRHRNVAKLLFIHMLGYPTHFGQMECLKLVSSSRFGEKRVGYLGMTQLLDENTDVLMMVTNSLKNDLNHSNQFVQGLALCSLGNIGSTEMCMALSREVERLFSVSNPYIRKKAALCAIRVVKKVSEIEDKFNHKIPSLMDDRNHGVLLGACSLVIALLELNHKEFAEEFRRLVPTVIKTLKNMLMSGYSNASEYDYSGITDPFLQVKLLRMLRVLGQGSQQASDEMNDILAQVATNTDGSKNAGNAILYECVQTIMSIEAESGLRILGINILGRFLLNRDNNIRYVALTTLKKVVQVDIKAVRNHRTTILECLKDNDISIRKRALDVTYCLVNEENIKAMAKELLNFLLVADLEFKEDLVSKICLCVDRYSPNKQWQIDTLIKVMCLAGNFVREEVRSKFCTLVAATPQLHLYTVHKIFLNVKDNLSQEALVIAGIWCVGEFGDLLVSGSALGPDQAPITVTPTEVLDLFQEISKMTAFAENPAKPGQTVALEYMVSALIKLVTRFPTEVERIRRTLRKFEQSMSMELQQRACEYQELMAPAWDPYRAGVLDRMPVEKINLQRRDDDDADLGPRVSNVVAPAPTSLNLIELDDSPHDAIPNAGARGGGLFELDILSGAQPAAPSGGDLDLNNLLGLDLNGPSVTAPVSAPVTAPMSGGASLLDDLLGGLGGSESAPPPVAPAATYPVAGFAAPAPVVDSFVVGFDKDGLKVVFNPTKLPPTAQGSCCTMTVRFHNTTTIPFENFVFEAAVPKYLQLNLLPANSTTVPPLSSDMSQVLNIVNTTNGEKPVVMRLRIGFNRNGIPVSEMGQVANFPQGL
eukprot:GEMP01004013.1.p1 GENE.GEMP01004013.1~~GEMP01004013.1.p1  ORF type:complete len:860 (+),score=180.19 GEMP01004013.1:211-2790(+)